MAAVRVVLVMGQMLPRQLSPGCLAADRRRLHWSYAWKRKNLNGERTKRSQQYLWVMLPRNVRDNAIVTRMIAVFLARNVP